MTNAIYPSRHSINEVVFFQPNIKDIDFAAMAPKENTYPVKAMIVGVSFTKSKVLYDIAVECEDFDGGFYTALPIRSIDSVMILPISDIKITGAV